MTRIGDRSFMFAWQALRAATQPNPEATCWKIADVTWNRSRYSLAAPDHATTIEVHRLHQDKSGESWSLMVVIEHWWDGHHKPLRNHLWATHVSGSKAGAIEWITKRAPGRAMRLDPDPGPDQDDDVVQMDN